MGLLVLALLTAGPAAAQAIPEDIPDKPEGLDEKTERELEERHHELLSRLFSTSQTGLVAQRAESGWGVLAYESFGLDLSRGQSIALAVGVQHSAVQAVGTCAIPAAGCWQTTVLASAQYELPLEQLVSTEALPGQASRYRLGFGLGVRSGAVDALRMVVTPQYAVPVNRYWTFSVGASAGLDAVSGASAMRPFAGGHVGVKVFPWGRRFDVLR